MAGERAIDGHGRVKGRTLALIAVVIACAGQAVALPPGQTEPADPPFPLGERLHYSVHWLGLKCGSMTLESFATPTQGDTEYVIVMTARTSKFFDGIHRVRTRIESRYSARRDSSVRYHSVSEEKKEVKDELYEFDLDGDRLLRVKNGREEEFELAADHVNDPLAYVYKLRLVEGGVGDASTLVLATTEGALETVARIAEQKLIRTEFGKRPALKIVPEPKDGMLFSKSGRMELWVGADPERTLYRIEFDLAFGKLTAILERREPVEMEAPAHLSAPQEADE